MSLLDTITQTDLVRYTTDTSPTIQRRDVYITIRNAMRMRAINIFSRTISTRRAVRFDGPNFAQWISFCALLVGLANHLITRADTVVVPNYATDVDANAQGIVFENGARVQNIYNSSQFLTAMPEGGIITQIAFRVDQSQRNSLSTVIPAVEIHMSTSPVTANSLSPMFSANTGADETIVFPTRSLTISIAGSKAGPNPFQIVFPFQTPFLYDPRRGSLCIDVFSEQESTQGLALDASGDLESNALQGPIGLSSGFGSASLVTQITFQPVPEPGAAELIALGACLTVLIRAHVCRS